MRYFWLWTILLLLAAGPGICAEAPQAETIVFWYGASPSEWSAYKEMVAEFEDLNPGIKVNAMLVPQKYVERKLILSVAGGVPPDVVRFYAHLGGELMSRGGLEPLDDLVKADKFDLSDFYSVGLKQNSFGGKLYGIPWVLSPNALFYNKRLFREVGLDPDKPPKTWRELQDCAMKLTKRDAKGKILRIGFADFLYNPNNFTTYLWQSGGDLIAADRRTPVFNGKQGAEALGWMKRFLEAEAGTVENLQVFKANFKGATQDSFGLEQIAMRIDTPFQMPSLKKYFPKLEYGVAPIPCNTQLASEVVGNALVIPRGSKHKEAAWKFIQFATNRKQSIRMCLAGGRIPARISVAKAPEFYSDPILRVFIDQFPNGRSVPVIPGWQESSEKLAIEIEHALKDQKPVQAALDDAAKAVNKVLLRANEDDTKLAALPWGKVAIAAVILLAGVIVGFVVVVRRQTAHSAKARREAKQFYLFAVPWILGFVVFTFGATVASLVISFSKWDTISAARFVGFRNYLELFTSDPRFVKSIGVTLYYTVFSVPLAIIGGIAISVLMNQKVFGIRLYRTVFYLPTVISGVATAVLWQFVFNPNNGLINRLLVLLKMPSWSSGHLAWSPVFSELPKWLQDPAWAMPAFIIMGVWGVGGAMVIYLAALQGVPEELYESARIDGAGPWKIFLSVTLPLLTPAIFYQLVTGTMFSLQMFTQAYIMTDGGPQDATMFYGLYLFKSAFEWVKMGYASAIAWLLFLAVCAITYIHFKGSARWVYYEGDQK